MTNKIKVFENKNVRTVWDVEEEDWYFSVVDVIEVLTETDRPRKYWNDLKKKLSVEGSELSEKIGQLKLQATDGKMRMTDVLSTKNILRLIQSIPSPKAEPFKVWLAQVGSERLDEIADPEKAILRGAYPGVASEVWIFEGALLFQVGHGLFAAGGSGSLDWGAVAVV